MCFQRLEIQKILEGYLLQDVENNLVLLSKGLRLFLYDIVSDNIKFVANVPFNGFGKLLNYKVVQSVTGILEPFEARFFSEDSFLIIAGGSVYLYKNKEFTELFRLNHYGFHIGRGVLPNGILITNDSIFIGEYWRNPTRESVFILRYKFKNRELEKIQIPWRVRHIHFIQKDPFTNKIFIGTGDNDDESVIAVMTPEDNDFHIIGSGSQLWRAVSLVFTKDFIFWGTDGEIDKSKCGIIGLLRNTNNIEIIMKTDSTIFYTAQTDNHIFFSKSGEFSDYLELLQFRKNFPYGLEYVGSLCFAKGKYKHHGTLRLTPVTANGLLISPVNSEEYGKCAMLLAHFD
ncbi:MAG: hypothetical protein ACTSYD_05110 [Candidatus Heimdallarchaeaceae archaeon]